MTRATGETAVVVVVDAVETAVARWRSLYDWSAGVGVPAHVTVLYPFLPLAEIDAAVVERLTTIFATEPAFELTFAALGRFTGSLLWLAPDPAEPFRRLTHAVWRAWPDRPPYGGAHDDVTPHLTVAEHGDEALLDAVAADVARALPLTTTVRAGQLLAMDHDGWATHATFPLGAAVVA